MDDGGDPRTEDSLPAAAAPGDNDAVATGLTIAAAADARVSPVMLARMLVSAGDSIDDEDELLSVLQRVVGIAHDVIPGADSTGVTIDLGGRTFTAVHTDHCTLRVDSEQYEAGEGPCLHASRTRSIVLVDAANAVDTWPRFTAAASEEGIRSFLAAPLFTPSTPWARSISMGATTRPAHHRGLSRHR